jgi:predicted nucleic acid-binding protein
VRVLLDSNCLVALALPAHEHHTATHADFQRRRASGQRVVIAAHVITEAYSVLTRLPPPHRLAPPDAFAVLDGSWGKSEVVALTALEWWRVLRGCARTGIGGGRVYDSAIAECARKAKAAEILTWNVRHFESMTGVRAVSPSP